MSNNQDWNFKVLVLNGRFHQHQTVAALWANVSVADSPDTGGFSMIAVDFVAVVTKITPQCSSILLRADISLPTTITNPDKARWIVAGC